MEGDGMKSTSVRLEDTMMDRVDDLAKAISRSRSWVINQAVSRFLEYEEWFVKEVQEGLKEVERGEIAPHDDVIKTFRKRGVNAG